MPKPSLQSDTSLLNLGNPLNSLDSTLSYFKAGQFDTALQTALAELPPLLNVAGASALSLGVTREAERYFELALNLNPQNLDALNNLSILYLNSGKSEQAEALLRQVLALQPDSLPALNILGVLLGRTGRHKEGESLLRRAVTLNPGFADAWQNLGVNLRCQGLWAEAEQAYRNLLQLAPGNMEAKLNLGLLLLSLGRFAEGWPLHECRFHPDRKPDQPLPQLPIPLWQGEPLAGKRLLLWHEQGFGDAIQFCRFVPELKKLGVERIGFMLPTSLAPLLETLSGLDEVHTGIDLSQSIDYDFWALPLSIPRWLETDLDNLPNHLPYLSAQPSRIADWKDRLPGSGLKVGLAWKGAAHHHNDQRRSVQNLADLEPLLKLPGVRLISLQTGQVEQELATFPAASEVLMLGQSLRDWADTAAIVSQLDLVISVDTALAHLAGSLNIPCWLMLAEERADWRWLKEREDSPWYPQVMRIFRNQDPSSWRGLVECMAQQLRRMEKLIPSAYPNSANSVFI